MSFSKRDNTDELFPQNTTQPRTSTLPTRSDKPLFVGRHDKTSRGIFGKAGKDVVESMPRPSSHGGWMSGKGPRLGLEEAFQRTDSDGNFLPPQRPSAREGVVSATSESRIPRTKTFYPQEIRSSPPQMFDDGYKLAARQGRASSMPLDSESDTGTRDGSPSPAARNRRWNREGSESDASLSLVEEPTNDDFDKKMSRFARDQARTRRMVSSEKGIYLKGQVGPRVAETTRTLARKASDSSLEVTEPPIRVPKTWGTKARRQDGWMRKILSPDTSLELKDAPSDPPFLKRQTTDADTPLPSVEDLSLTQNLTPPASRPASAQPNNGSPEKSQLWSADLDFTAQSLQINTSPQLRVRNTALDEIREREIQSLSARAVATNRLEEIRERNSEDRSINGSSVQLNLKESPLKENKTPEPQQEDFQEMTILEEEGEHIQGTPITIFSKAAYEHRSRSNSSSRERSLNQDREGSLRKANHRRDDSRELLRRLSRSVSHSPAPEKPIPKQEEKPAKPPNLQQPREKTRGERMEAEIAEVKPYVKEEPPALEPQDTDANLEKLAVKRSNSSSRSSGLDIGRKRYSAISTPPKSDVDPEERIRGEERLFDLQDNKSEKNSVKGLSRSPSPTSDDGQFDETPRPKPRVDPLSLPTPKVTGAYIETPAPTVRKPRKSRSISPHYEVINAPANEGSTLETKATRDVASAPNLKDRPRRQLRRTSSLRDLSTDTRATIPRPLINTAKPPSAADDLRRIQQETQLDDNTLDDFDALLEADAALTTDFQDNTIILEPILDLEYDERGLPLSKKAIERRIERIQLDRMSQSIKNTSSSIRDARHGIERLEEQVSSSLPNITKASDETLYINLKIPVPKLWISQPPQNPGMKPGWKLTWLGLILAIFSAWYISESVMCAQFCHPESSTVNTWQPSDPFFPWAIPTKLDQWTGQVISSTASDIWDVIGWKPRKRYGGGPLSADDWWLGRSGPVGIKLDDDWMRSIDEDELI